MGSFTELSGPADLAIQQMEDGSYLVVVPELTARDATPETMSNSARSSAKFL